MKQKMPAVRWKGILTHFLNNFRENEMYIERKIKKQYPQHAD
jgi:hypothetical protein